MPEEFNAVDNVDIEEENIDQSEIAEDSLDTAAEAPQSQTRDCLLYTSDAADDLA